MQDQDLFPWRIFGIYLKFPLVDVLTDRLTDGVDRCYEIKNLENFYARSLSTSHCFKQK